MGDLVRVPFGVGAPLAQRPDAGPGLPQEGRQGWSEARRLWWQLWRSCPGVGWSRLTALERHCGDLEAAWSAPLEQLAGVPGMGRAVLLHVSAHRQRWGPDPLAGARLKLRSGGPVLLPGDPSLPPSLLELDRPPLALHWRGHGALWPCLRRRLAVAVVGTRRPSRHGLAMARALGMALAEAGWPVVSGLAEGIDAAAHQGCLARAGRPVAVLGTPLERTYPRHHGPLQRQVGERGLLITEQAGGAGVRPGNFAARNRLQVALSRAVVLVECPQASGALHSASLAWDQGLPLWVVPADAGKPTAAGSNRLLAQGASPLLEPADLIRQLGPGPLAGARRAAGTPASDLRSGVATPYLGRAQAELLQVLGPGACLEEICSGLGRPVSEVASLLLELELAGRVLAEPGLSWRPL